MSDEELIGYRWSLKVFARVKLQLQIPEIKVKDEWLAINPAYEPMLEKVEDDEWNKEI